ncbi:MAG: acyl-phosphate glycerol 3-phosphate acyltransferase [Candidatus Margulisbacteria bacterium GWF2_35_9]|nr:MAG: acyl-phosphate glycerol 3-phosphate acyltransferase [Candidatus Margulisbacteria bacterium GWF2_35_9]
MIIKIIIVIISYLLGSIPFSYIIGRLKGVNLLEVGSKNAGATNVYRNLGLAYALMAFLLDVGKGYFAMLLGKVFFVDQYSFIVLCGLAAILGHTFTPFLKFKGGKGVATGIGILLFINPVIAIAAFALGISIILSTRYVSLGSIISSLFVLAMSLLPYFKMPTEYQIFICIAVVYIIYKHVPNIKRLLIGQENKV